MYKTGETTGETQEPIAVVGLDVSVGDIGFTWPGAGSRILKRRCRHNIGRSARETLAVNTGGCCAGGGHSGEMCPIIVRRMHIAGRRKAVEEAKTAASVEKTGDVNMMQGDRKCGAQGTLKDRWSGCEHRNGEYSRGIGAVHSIKREILINNVKVATYIAH